MTQLSFAQLEQYWIQAGGSPVMAPEMASIAEAESGGRSDALNNNPGTGDYSVGPWQINYFGNLSPGRTARYGSPSTLQASPLADARAAVDLSSNGQNLSPWSTWKSGAYEKFMPSGAKDIKPSGASFSGGNWNPANWPDGIVQHITGEHNAVSNAPVNAAHAVTGAFSGVEGWLIRAGLIVLGTGLALVGLYLIARSFGAPAVGVIDKATTVVTRGAVKPSPAPRRAGDAAIGRGEPVTRTGPPEPHTPRQQRRRSNQQAHKAERAKQAQKRELDARYGGDDDIPF